MLRKILLALAVALLVVPLASGGASGAEGWVIQVAPRYVFNGENVSVTLTGIPNAYAFIQLATNETDAFGNVTLDVIDDRFLQLDDLGVVTANFTIPIDAQSGWYSVHAVYSGREVSNASFEVIYDKNLHNQYLIDELMGDLDRTNRMLAEYGRTTQTLLEREWQMWVLAPTAMGLVVLIGALVAWKFKDYIEWRTASSKRKDGMSRVAKFFLAPSPKGDLGPYLKQAGIGTRTYVEEVENRERGLMSPKPFVVMPDGSVLEMEVTEHDGRERVEEAPAEYVDLPDEAEDMTEEVAVESDEGDYEEVEEMSGEDLRRFGRRSDAEAS